jgi:hypothetical protein
MKAKAGQFNRPRKRLLAAGDQPPQIHPMTGPKILHFHLDAHLRSRHAAGEGGMLNQVTEAVQAAGWQARLVALEDSNGRPAAPGYHLVLNLPVQGPSCLSLRKSYRDPFWKIEDTNDRWDYQIARTEFDPAAITSGFNGFMGHWKPRFLGETPAATGLAPFVFVPLQGKLTERRHFQSMSPLEMITTVLDRDRDRKVIATLHPRETYGAEDLQALGRLVASQPRFSVEQADSLALIKACDYIVTQNSSVAVTGYFAAKPAVLFARIDFHHIAGSVPRQGVAAAFAQLGKPAPDFARYLYWFLELNSIRPWDKSAQERIRARLRQFGWPI